MIEGLIGLLVLIIIVGIVAWLVIWLIDTIPLPAPFGQIARVLVILIAVLIILYRALPLIGISL
jgi:hypothetical protein